MTRIPRVLVALLAIASLPAQANSRFTDVANFGLYVHDSGQHVLVQLTTPLTNPEGCTNNIAFALSKSHQSFKELYAALLSAYHTGTSINGWINGCDSLLGMPLLTRVDLPTR